MFRDIFWTCAALPFVLGQLFLSRLSTGCFRISGWLLGPELEETDPE